MDISLPSGMHSDAAIETALSNAVLKLGYPALRSHQKTAITSFVQGRDVFVCLPTGSGKSRGGYRIFQRGVETRDTKSVGGGGGAVPFRPDTKKRGGGGGGGGCQLQARYKKRGGGGGGGGGGAVKQKRGRYLI